MPAISTVNGTCGALAPKRAFTFAKAPAIGFLSIASGSSVTIPITAPSDTGGYPVIDYTIISNPATTTKTTSSAGNYTFTGLTPGTVYTFTVKARTIYGTSSDSTNFGISGSVTPDEAPGKMTVTLNTDNATTSTWGWNAPTNNGTAITEWGRQVSTDNGVNWGTETIVALGTTSYSIAVATGPSSGVYTSPDTNTYRVRVRAYNSSGTPGAWSDNDNRNTPWSISTFTNTDTSCSDTAGAPAGVCYQNETDTRVDANENTSVACGAECGSQAQYRTPKANRTRVNTRTRSRTRTDYKYTKGAAETASYGAYAGGDWSAWTYSAWSNPDWGAYGAVYYDPNWTNTGGCGAVATTAIASPAEGQTVSISGWLNRNGAGGTAENQRYRRYVGFTGQWAVADSAGNITYCRAGCSGTNCCLYSIDVKYCSAYGDYVPYDAAWWNICGNMYGVYAEAC